MSGKTNGPNKLGAMAFIKAALSFFTDPKAAAGGTSALALVVIGAGYVVQDVNAKHQDVLKRVEKNTSEVQAAKIQNEKILVTLVAIKDSIDDVKTSVRDTKAQVDKTSDRVWSIGRDVYVLKTRKIN